MIQRLRAIPASQLRLIVFDLDGTLIDSRDDLTASVNATLRHFGCPLLPEDVIASYIGDGASMLVRRSLGDPSDESFVDRAVEYFLDYYRDHKLDHTYVYAGVLDVLASMRSARGDELLMAVLSNKPVGPAQAICEALGLAPYFFAIYGGNSFDTKKPNPEGLQTLIREAGVSADQTVMIGDTDVDILTARNCGAWAIGARFGLSPHTLDHARPDCTVDHPLEWKELLLPPRESLDSRRKLSEQ